MSIQIYFKYKYTYENAGFCILCMDVFKILKTIEIFHDFHRKTSQATTPPPTSTCLLKIFNILKSATQSTQSIQNPAFS